MALHDLDQHAVPALDRLEGTGRVMLRWRKVVGDRTLTRRFGTLRRGNIGGIGGSGDSRRPRPPSLRLPRAQMSRAAFLMVIGGWLAAVAGVAVLVLLVRAFA